MGLFSALATTDDGSRRRRVGLLKSNVARAGSVPYSSYKRYLLAAVCAVSKGL
jgi:hypothetical protein